MLGSHGSKPVIDEDLRGRLHHVCFHYISAQHLFDVAELAKEAGIPIESGPARHGIGGAPFIYILEPGGNRIELMGDPGYMIFDPAWKTVVWKGSEVPDVGAVWTGSPLPDSFWSYGTPPAEELRLLRPRHQWLGHDPAPGFAEERGCWILVSPRCNNRSYLCAKRLDTEHATDAVRQNDGAVPRSLPTLKTSFFEIASWKEIRALGSHGSRSARRRNR